VKRRDLLRLTGAGAVATTTGCLGALGLGEENGNTVLPPPENNEIVQGAELPYPVYGERLPEATVEAPLRDTEVSTRGFVGERHVLLTFFFARCDGVCPGLTANLVQVQADAAERGYEDEVALLATNFDPAHDTPDVLREYADNMGIDRDAGNFYLLRPNGEERAREVVEDTFGHGYEKSDIYSVEGDGGGDGAETTEARALARREPELELLHRGEHEEGEGGDEEKQLFIHQPLFLLANKDGYVERSYGNRPPTPNTVLEDVRELTDA